MNRELLQRGSFRECLFFFLKFSQRRTRSFGNSGNSSSTNKSPYHKANTGSSKNVKSALILNSSVHSEIPFFKFFTRV